MITDALPIEVTPVATLLGGAFAATPQSRWIVPDDTDRPRLLADLFAPLVEHAVKYGRVGLVLDSLGDMHAAAVWLPSDAPEPLEPTGRYASRWAAFSAALAAQHPAAPHRHLALVGVRPDRQGRGFGTALLNHHHSELREAAYLEVESPQLAALYWRYGYRPGPAFLMPSGLPMWPMWRPVRAGAPG